MISFIVIGRNEGKTLTRCLESIYSVINKLSFNWEVIYVDSNSEDNSIEIAKSYPETKIYKINYGYNAAVARNIGANESSGKVLFFVDGDMEITSDFLLDIIGKSGELKYDYTSGQLINRFYDASMSYCGENKAFPNLTKERKEYATGGVFVIKREHWFLIRGMKTKYKISQDLDLGLRLARKGIFLTRTPKVIATHHTALPSKRFDYFQLFKNKKLFYKGMLMREHFFNYYAYPRLLRMDFSYFFLLLSLILAFFWKPLSILIYFTIIFTRAIWGALRKKNKFIYLFSLYLLRDFAAFLGFVFFYPSSLKYGYHKIKVNS